MINYDHDKVPNIDPESLDWACSRGLKTMCVICLDEDNPEDAVQFVVFGQSTPRLGEQMKIEDGTRLVVESVLHKFSRTPEGHPLLVQTIVALKR